jgi:DNA-binding MarR family transcriptional regulator
MKWSGETGVSEISTLEEGMEVVGNLKDKLDHSMPRPLYDHNDQVVLEAERDIRAKLGDRPFDFEALLAVSNIYRAANAVRNRMEREILGPAGLTWGGFTILFVLWVWGDRETGQLAEDCGLAKGTLSGMLTTLEKTGLVERSRHSEDGRRVVVALRPEGRDAIESVFPEFNRYEAKFTAELDDDERRELARLLRRVTSTADEVPLISE